MKGFYLLFFIVFSLFFSLGAKAQQGNVVVHADPRLSLLLKKNHPEIASSERLDAHKSPTGDLSQREAFAHPAGDLAIHPAEGLKAPQSDNKMIASTLITKTAKAPEAAGAAPDVPSPRPSVTTGAVTDRPASPLRTASPEVWAPKRHVRTLYSGKGFRVQIYYGPDRAKALNVRNEFSRNNPGVRTYLSYISPCFRVKIGDYRRRSDAEVKWREVNAAYNPSMIVPDMITITTIE
jgi:hypothetical protein